MAGYIYFMRSQAGGYKIGYSTNVEKRVRGLQTANASELQLVGYTDGSPKLERQVHATLSKFKRRGEWFSDCFTVRKFIAEALLFGVKGALAEVLDKNLVHEWTSNAKSNRVRLDFLKAKYG